MIPKYIINKIRKQHELLSRADKISQEIIDWYDKKIDNTYDVNTEEYWDITFEHVPYILKEAILHNLELSTTIQKYIESQG